MQKNNLKNNLKIQDNKDQFIKTKGVYMQQKQKTVEQKHAEDQFFAVSRA